MKSDVSFASMRKILNIVELVQVMLILLLVFSLQYILYELPCNLCLLERWGFFGICLGLLVNLRFSPHPGHYAMIILSTLFTSFVALRHISLPGVLEGSTEGQPFLGFHLNTWLFIATMIIIISTSIIMVLRSSNRVHSQITSKKFIGITHILFIIFILLMLVNFVSIMFECGFRDCPEKPVHYLL